MTTIDVSAQFGGRDAAQAVLPHFRALKAVQGRLSLDGFPFSKLALILRVDGEVSTFGAAGPWNVRVDAQQQYVSVDIVITRGDLEGRDTAAVSNVISAAIVASSGTLQAAREERLKGVNWDALGASLRAFADEYKVHVKGNW